MMQTSVWKGVLSAAVLALAVASGRAQDATTGSISGTVTDPTGAIIKGATVVVIDADRNHVERTLTTSASGFYTATSLPLGHYIVKVTDKGFKTETVTGIELHVADALTVNSKLSPGSEGEAVTVTAQAQSINLENATSAGLINGNQIDELVMVSRNYETLINLQPGVAYGGTTDQLQRGPLGVNGASSTVVFSVNGGRSTSNNWTIDGADNLDRGANLTLYVYPSPGAIAEFKTLRAQYSAANGRNSSGQVDVVTKSGTNLLHGSAYEYFRNDFLDANTYINDYNNALAGYNKSPTPKYRYNDFGFTLGGPVLIPHVYNGKDKTFWFVSENWLREITYTSGSSAVNVPTPAEIAGDFSNEWYIDSNKTSPTYNKWIQGPLNVCTAYTNNASLQTNTCTASGTKITNFSPTAQAYLKDVYSKIPQNSLAQQQTYAANGIDPHSLYATLRNEYPNLDSVVRIDQQFGSKVTAFYRYVHDTFPEFIGAGTFTLVPIPGLSSTYSNNPGTQHLGKVTWAATPTLVANLGYAYSTGQIVTRPTGGMLQSASPDINIPEPYTNNTGINPTIAVSGFQSITATPVYNDHGYNHEAFGSVTKVLRNHSLIAGISYNHYNKVENATGANVQGSFGFTSDIGQAAVTLPTGQTQSATINQAQSFANFLIGNANNGFSQASRNPQIDVSENIWAAYIQDNWKATPRLTVNVGVRYDFDGQPTDAAGYLNNFDPAKYSAAAAPTIANNGLICITAPCSQVGSNAGMSTAPNPSADIVGASYINGLIYGTPNAANNNQASPFGKAVSTSQKFNFAPRLGFAFDLFGDGKSALRGGYGIAYDELEVSQWETTGIGGTYGINPPGASTYPISQASLDSPSGGQPGGTTFLNNTAPGHLYAVPVNTKTPYLQQYSLGIQTQFNPSLVLELAYVGTHGTHLGGQEEINQPRPGAWRGVVQPQYSGYSAANPTGSGCNYTPANPTATVPMFWNSTCDRVLNQVKPYLGYYAIDALRTIFSSNYNSLQAKITLRGKGKSYIDGNFTWSRDLTNNPGDSTFVQDIYNVNGDYGRAAYDRKLIFNIDGVYELPWFREQHGLVGRLIGGWEASGILAMNSGIPYTVSSSGATSLQYNGGYSQPAYYASNPSNLANDNAGLALLGNTNGGIRPNQIGDANSGGGKQLRIGHKYENPASLYVNTGAFVNTDPLSNVPGTAKRGSLTGPGFIRADVGIFRNFRIVHNTVFQFRGEAFNVANHPNPATIQTSATNAYFGEVTAYRDPRILQLAGRITF
jgi:hypothetical protein